MNNVNVNVAYAAHIAYDGTHYAGFQSQDHANSEKSLPEEDSGNAQKKYISTPKPKPTTTPTSTSKLPTIQARIESALTQLQRQPTQILYAGRTDAGVHARQQMISWEATSLMSLPEMDRFQIALNALLRKDIVCLKIYPVSPSFHPRRACLARKYCYYVHNATTPPIFGRPYVAWIKKELQVQRMRNNFNLINGRHDFSSFTKRKSRPENPFRTVHYTRLISKGNLLIFEICSSGFLHHMVRNIVGTILELEYRGHMSFAQILAARDRTMAGSTAPAQGLFLDHLYYPKSAGTFGTINQDKNTKENLHESLVPSSDHHLFQNLLVTNPITQTNFLPS